ncbi:MAG TPA: universal stress protein [Verrucomicrobiae bacterium]|nr:universal stress protein [Verrucomicrobiae bacterium]
MKRLNKILVPTDLSEKSLRALHYGCGLAAEDQAAMVILHVANDLNAWELYSEDLAFIELNSKPWPIDRILAEASLDLTRFLEQQLQQLRRVPMVTRRVVLGSVAKQIVAVAEEESTDLIIMAPRRHRGLRHFLNGGITDRVTRLSPCPVLSITAPQPSNPWRGKLMPLLFGGPRQRVASV